MDEIRSEDRDVASYVRNLEEQLVAMTAKCEEWESAYRTLFENSRQTRMRLADTIRRMEEGEL